jgi:hypothetical protein
MTALMEDTFEGQRPKLSLRLSMAWAGLRERGHESGLIGDTPSPSERSRSGSLLILCAWAAFVLAGCSYAKMSEHFSSAMPPGTRALPQAAIHVVTVAAAAGACLVTIGGLVALPAFVRFIRQGGWAHLRRHFIRAATVSVLAVAMLFALAHWAVHLSEYQRNGSDGWYSLAVTAWVLLVAVVVALWTIAGVASVRRLSFAPRVLLTESALGVALTSVMALITTATALWWATIAAHAPWFLQGTTAGTPASPVTLNLVVTLTLMVLALGVAVYGTIRIVGSWGNLTAS